MDLFEAMNTNRTIRHLKPDPVPEELVERLIWAATRAPSPGNSQGYGFVVVTDRAKLAQIGDAVCAVIERVAAAASNEDPTAQRIMAESLHLARTVRDLPMLIVVAGRPVYPPNAPDERHVWSALYAATQNMLLAARALGLGTTITTYHHLAGPTIREVLAVPDDVRIGAVIAVGWPDRPFGPVRRRPIVEFIHRDGW